ncbi:hypothetical protein CKO45_15110 [Paracraurococcus ruber]|uniref:Uncharacterized protein n=1 Tax=Paracraurococcus ruber TaxID=77675 RepID=A0ABS1CZ23_9PROT|nr:hypothetical protein [Paracraurococcus ruber]
MIAGGAAFDPGGTAPRVPARAAPVACSYSGDNPAPRRGLRVRAGTALERIAEGRQRPEA